MSKPINDTTYEPPVEVDIAERTELTKDVDDVSLTEEQLEAISRQRELIVDATACPQDISYPTDLNLLW